MLLDVVLNPLQRRYPQMRFNLSGIIAQLNFISLWSQDSNLFNPHQINWQSFFPCCCDCAVLQQDRCFGCNLKCEVIMRRIVDYSRFNSGIGNYLTGIKFSHPHSDGENVHKRPVNISFSK